MSKPHDYYYALDAWRDQAIAAVSAALNPVELEPVCALGPTVAEYAVDASLRAAAYVAGMAGGSVTPGDLCVTSTAGLVARARALQTVQESSDPSTFAEDALDAQQFAFKLIDKFRLGPLRGADLNVLRPPSGMEKVVQKVRSAFAL